MTSPAEDLSARSRVWAVRLVVAGLVLSVFSGHSQLLHLPISLDRVLIPAGIALLFVTGHFHSSGRLRWRWVHSLMLLAVAWTVWSALTHGTLLQSQGFYALLDRVVIPFALFTLAPVIFRTEDDRRLLLKTLIALGLYLGLTAIFEMVGPKGLVFPSFIADPTVGSDAPTAEALDRARGPFLAAEANGMVLAAAVFAGLIGFRRLSGSWRLAAGLAVPLGAIGVLLTLTRSVWVGTALGLVVVCLITPTLRRRLPVVLGGIVASVGALLLTVPSLSTLVVDRLTTQRSVYDRQNTDVAALRIISSHPVDGIGWSRFVQETQDWVRQADTYPITNVQIEIHNVVLSRAAELGLIGAALYVACILGGPGRAVIRRPFQQDLADWRLIVMGFGCVWGVVAMLSPLPYPLPNTLLWLLSGMVLQNYLVDPVRRTDRSLRDLPGGRPDDTGRPTAISPGGLAADGHEASARP